MSFKGNQPTVERLAYTEQSSAPSNPKTGDTYLQDGSSNTIEQGLYIYNGSAWEKVNFKRENLITNGDFQWWQRGTSFDGGSVRKYADRWVSGATATGATISQQSFTAGQTDVPGEPRYFLRYAQGSVAQNLFQGIRDLRKTAGRTYTISFYAKTNSAQSLTFNVTQDFGSGGSTDVTVLNTSYNLTTSWQRFSFTFTVDSISGKTLGTNDDHRLEIYLFTNSGTGSDTFDFAHIMMNEGNFVADFQPFGGTVEQDYKECLRYFRKSLPYYADPGTATSTGTFSQETNGHSSNTYTIRHSVNLADSPMAGRLTPTITIYNTSGTSGQANVASGSVAASVDEAFVQGFRVSATDGVAGGTRSIKFHWTIDVEY